MINVSVSLSKCQMNKHEKKLAFIQPNIRLKSHSQFLMESQAIALSFYNNT